MFWRKHLWHVRRLRGMRTTFPHFKQVRVQYSTDGWRDPSLLATNHSLRSFPPADPFCGSAAVGVPKWSAPLPFPWTFCKRADYRPDFAGETPPHWGQRCQVLSNSGSHPLLAQMHLRDSPSATLHRNPDTPIPPTHRSNISAIQEAAHPTEAS